jgi:hypothetical protein
MENQLPEFQVISKAERSARDPRGLSRVTLLSDSVIIKTDQFPKAVEPKESAPEAKTEIEIPEFREKNDG